MPKSSKHKKERTADFTKAKLKLGKGKQVASNATNTSFAAKSIALPSQSLSEAPKSAPTSRRNLTLPELLVQCRHYSVPVKREALSEISQLLTTHPYLLTQHLLPLTTTLAHLVPDASASVRQSTRDLLRLVAGGLAPSTMASISPGVVLFTLSALSALDDPVRIDALKVLDLLLEVIPGEITRGWDGTADVAAADLLAKDDEDKGTGRKVVEALLGMLKVRSAGLQQAHGAFTTGAAGSDLSPSARLAVLTTLASFLRASLAHSSSSTSSTAPWYLSTSFSTRRAYASFLASFSSSSSPTRSVTPTGAVGTALSAPLEPFALALFPAGESADLALSSFGLFTPPSSPGAPSTSSSSSTSAAPPTLLSLLHPTLLSSFLDAAPTAFAPSAADALALSSSSGAGGAGSATAAALETVEAVFAVARELFHRALSGQGAGGEAKQEGAESGASEPADRRNARKALLALLSHAAPYFPFGSSLPSPSSSSSSAAGQAADARALSLNLQFAELSSLLVLAEADAGERRAEKKGKGKAGEREREKRERVEEVVGGRVMEWVVAALKGELTTPTHPLGLPLPASAYAALEPTLWALLNQPDAARAKEVWDAVLVHSSKSAGAGGAETRRRAWEFAARAVLIQSDPAYVNRFDLVTLGAVPRSSQSQSQGGDLAADAPLARWIAAMPKWLWELGAKDAETSELVLSFLLKLAQQGLSKGVLPRSALSPLLTLLPPFFHLQHPTRGALPGPFCRLPAQSGAQEKALAVGWYLCFCGMFDEEEGRGLREAVERAVRATEGSDGGWARGRWAEMGGAR
ncbi:hypothetical protein JCM10207_006411 [Rhodosporidiobolus poonsookiae]